VVIQVVPPGTPTNPTVTTVYPIASASGSIVGFDAAAITVDSSAFPSAAGAWSVRKNASTLELVFTPAGYAAWIAGYPGIVDASEDGDPDSDGWSNHDEWVTGTDPTSIASRFAPEVSSAGLTFTRIPGRSYVVQTSTDLVGWTAHANVSDGSGSVTVPHPSPAGAIRFYRVVIQLETP
jgi:hypothetical protein